MADERRTGEGTGQKSITDEASIEAPDPGAEDLEAVSLPMLGRLFGVPFLIVSIIVGGAIVVVFLFGGPSAPRERSVDELLSMLEANSGEKSAGVLLPQEKKLWQAALELGRRLQKKEAEFSDDELVDIATRLSKVVIEDLRHVDTISTFDEYRETHREVRSRRMQFSIRALGRTGRPEAVEPLAEVVRTAPSPFDFVAVQELGNLGNLPAARQQIGLIAEQMSDGATDEMLLSCCPVLAVLARDAGDALRRTAIEALTQAYHSREGEVAWSAALSLTRLGSPVAKSMMLDLLDRGFWEGGDRYVVEVAAGVEQRYALPAGRIDEFLIAAIDAAATSGDRDLWELIEQLKSDKSPRVRRHAIEVSDVPPKGGTAG